MRIGVIAALEEEGDAFFHAQGRVDLSGPMPLRRLSAHGHDADYAGHWQGQHGDSGERLLLTLERCDLLLIIGTAGLIGARDERRCFWLDSAVQHDFGAAQQRLCPLYGGQLAHRPRA